MWASVAGFRGRSGDGGGSGGWTRRRAPGPAGPPGRGVRAAFDPSVLLSYTLLHVYSDLPWYLREVGAPARETLPALAEAWFGAAG